MLGNISVVYEPSNYFYYHLNFKFFDTPLRPILFAHFRNLTFEGNIIYEDLQIWFFSAISFLRQHFNAKICYFIRF